LSRFSSQDFEIYEEDGDYDEEFEATTSDDD
jgi:hypothetical protein